MPNVRLYIDVDDTIIAENFVGSGFDLRPAILTQLTFLARLFDCYWLTHWPHKDLNEWIGDLYANRIVKTFKYMNWQAVDNNNKATAVVQGPHDFWWLEDPLSTGDMRTLRDQGLADRYIPVAPKGPWGFAYAVNELFAKAGVGDNELKRVGAKIGWFSFGLPDVSRKDQIMQGTFTSGFVSNGKQHCGDCIHRLDGDRPYCIHPEVLTDPEVRSKLTVIDNKTVAPIDGDRDCCGYSNKTKGESS